LLETVRVPPLSEMGPMNCNEAFAFFVQAYHKVYGDEKEAAFQRFCRNYESLRRAVDAGKCPNCIIYSIMDTDVPNTSRSPQLLQKKLIQHRLGAAEGEEEEYEEEEPEDQSYVFSYALHDETISRLNYHYDSIDLREAGLVTTAKNQENCGSCWAFSVTATMENLLLRQRPYLAREKQYTDFWNLHTETLDLSEEFLMANDYYNNFCYGGLEQFAFKWLQWYNLPFEFEQNYPYQEANCD